MTLTLQDKNSNTVGAAKNLVLYGTTAMSSDTSTNGWCAGATVPFVYDGANWIRFFWDNNKVTQNAAITTDGSFPLLLSKSTNTTVETDTINKQGSLFHNPNSKTLTLDSGDNTKGAIYLKSPAHTFGLINGSGGTNYGIYDNTTNNTKWVLVDDGTHNWRVKANAERVDYLTCPTAAGTAGKTVTTAQGGPANFTLSKGTSIYITFDNENTVNNPTLNISGSGAKAIYYKGVRVIYQGLTTGIVYHMVYDGTNWVIVNEIQARAGTASNNAGTAGKTVTCPGFVLCTNNVAYVKFTNTNSHATPTLNINSTGAKNIVFQGATTTHAYRILRAGITYVFRYNGSQYEFLGDNFYHVYVRGVSAIAATYYTQQDYDDYVAANGEPPTWNVGDEKTAAVAATTGYESLLLGNSTTSNTTNGMNGQLGLYGSGSGYHVIKTALTGSTNRNIYIPNYGGDGYLTHTANANAVGSTTQPVYVAANGRITAITGAIANNTTGSAATLTTTRKIDGINFNGSADVLHYGTCSTGASTAAKTVAITGFVLTTGAVFYVKFSNANTANSPTLNVNSTGAKNIYFQNGTRLETTSNYPDYLQSGKFYQFVYDGTNYVLINNPNVLELYEKRGSTTSLNKAAITGGAGAMFHLVASSTTTTGKCPTDANVLQMNWDNNGGYDGQLAISTADSRLYVRSQASAGTAWREAATIVGATETGSTTTPVYVNNKGQITAITGTLANSISGNAATATKFASSQSIALTGDVTGSASSQAGWSIATTIGSGKVTNDMLAGSIANGKLTNSKVTIAGNDVSLGGSLSADTLRTSLGLSNAMHFKGTTTTAMSDGLTTAAVTIGGSSYTPEAGDVVLYSDSEFVWTGSAWERLGRDSSFKVTQTAITDSTGTSESTTATRFVYSISQDANGVVSVKTRPLPTYNNYSLPLAASGTRGGIQIGYAESGTNYAVKLSSEKAYVTVPWTDTKVTAVGNHYTPSADTESELTAALSGTAGTYAVDTEYTVLTGVKAQRDAKGHVTGLTYTAQKIKDTNTTYTLPTASSSTLGGIKVNGNGLKVESDILKHSNSVTAKTSFGSTATSASANGGSITVTDVKYDSNGHITGSQDRTITLSQTTYTIAGLMGSTAKGSTTLPIYWSGTAFSTITSYEGNAATATTLATARTINGTSFNGSADITTTQWGTARNISISDSDGTNTGTAVSVNGSAAATLKLPSTIKASLTGAASLNVLKAGDTMTGNLTMSTNTYVQKVGSSVSWYQGRKAAVIKTTSYSGYNSIYSLKTTDGDWSCGVYTGNKLYWTYITDANYNASTNTTTAQMRLEPNGYLYTTRTYGAVWNDYAEYRKDNPNEVQQPGRCVKEIGDGSLTITTKRLERGCEIISDTYGFSIGQDEKNGYNTPIASNGRVLAYPYELIEEFASHIGWPVCSGPDGTVSIMTEEEEEKYPSRIIGTISEIPDYEEWGTGKVKVNGRVWIRIK